MTALVQNCFAGANGALSELLAPKATFGHKKPFADLN
jgi:hypothetical protein